MPVKRRNPRDVVVSDVKRLRTHVKVLTRRVENEARYNSQVFKALNRAIYLLQQRTSS